ncbi:MAG: M48 family metalloprotease [Chloroflexota bacterium]
MGLLLYILTVFGEVPAIAFRYWVVNLLGPPWLALLVALLPQVWSVATLVGFPGGHRFTSWELGARVPSQREQREIEQTFKHLSREGVRLPHKTFIVDTPTVNAFVVGSTLYLHRQLVWTSYLVPVTAHELGHINSLDGRLNLALHRLLFPGASWFLRGLFHRQDQSLSVLSSFAVRGCFLVSWLFFCVLTILVLFGGGFGTLVLALAWRNYWRGREYYADAFAAKLGQGSQLAEALEANYLLLDMATPWFVWTNRVHPYTEYRIDRLQRLAAGEQLDDALAPHERRELVVISTLSGGAVLVFFGMCGAIPLTVSGMVATAEQAQTTIQGEVQEQFDEAQGTVERRAEAFVQRQVDGAVESLSEGMTRGMTRAFTGQDPPTPTPTLQPVASFECNQSYIVVSELWLYEEPNQLANVLDRFYPSDTSRERVTYVCNEEAPSGWLQLQQQSAFGASIGWSDISTAQHSLYPDFRASNDNTHNQGREGFLTPTPTIPILEESVSER